MTGSSNAPPSLAQGRLALLLGLLAVSTSAPCFMMSGVDAYAAVFWRTSLAGLGALALAHVRGRLQLRALRDQARCLLPGGVLLGAHFLLWVKAFELTDYASNLLLLVAQPIAGALLGRALGEPLPRRAWLSVALAFGGLLAIAGADVSLGPRALLGDVFAVVAAALIASFYVVARPARDALPLEAFMGATLLVAACTALPVAWLSGVPLWGYSTQGWLWLGAMVLIATMAGHSLLNLAARSVSLFTLNLVIVLEPPLSIAFGAVLFGATLGSSQLLGGVLLSAAVVLGFATPAAATVDARA